MKFWVNKNGQAIDAGSDHAAAAMTHIMSRAVVARISNDTLSDGLPVAIRDWMQYFFATFRDPICAQP